MNLFNKHLILFFLFLIKLQFIQAQSNDSSCNSILQKSIASENDMKSLEKDLQQLIQCKQLNQELTPRMFAQFVEELKIVKSNLKYGDAVDVLNNGDKSNVIVQFNKSSDLRKELANAKVNFSNWKKDRARFLKIGKSEAELLQMDKFIQYSKKERRVYQDKSYSNLWDDFELWKKGILKFDEEENK